MLYSSSFFLSFLSFNLPFSFQFLNNIEKIMWWCECVWSLALKRTQKKNKNEMRFPFNRFLFMSFTCLFSAFHIKFHCDTSIRMWRFIAEPSKLKPELKRIRFTIELYFYFENIQTKLIIGIIKKRLKTFTFPFSNDFKNKTNFFVSLSVDASCIWRMIIELM